MRKRTKFTLTLGSLNSVQPPITQERGSLLNSDQKTPFLQSMERMELTESEERQLMLRLEELAQIEGFREDRTKIKISSATQALIDSKAAEGEVLKHDGSVALSADWDAGDHEIRTQTLQADIGVGTSPLVITSTTKVENLNADMVDGYDFDQALQTTDSPEFAGLTLSGNITMPDGSTIGQASGPLLTFDDTDNYLKITGCKLNIGTPDTPIGSNAKVRIYEAGSSYMIVRNTTNDIESGLGTTTADGFAGTISNHNFALRTNNQSRITIKNSGNVGIGTTTPGSKFEVLSSTFPVIRGIRSTSYNSGAWSAMDLLHKTSAASISNGFGVEFSFAIADATSGSKSIAAMAGVRDGADNSGSLLFNTWNSGVKGERMRIDHAGNVGINTTGPDRKLEVLDASNPQLRLAHTDGTTYTDFQTDSSGHLTIDPTGGEVNIDAIVDYTASMNNSTKDPTSDAPDDWVEIKIGGVQKFIPCYNA